MEAITSLVNMLVFGVTLIRGRLALENGAREVLATLGGPKLYEINGMGLTTIHTGGGGLQTLKTGSTEGLQNDSTKGEKVDLGSASVVMLSNATSNCSMKQFMKSKDLDNVHSILLQYRPCNIDDVTSCEGRDHQCKCIVFSTVEEITIMLVRRMPGTLKRVSDSMCLLPSLTCLNNGCHGLLHVDQLGERLTDGGPRAEFPAAVCRILDEIDVQSINAGEPICICIPTHDAGDDKWTELLMSSFKSKDAEARGVKVTASEALQEYLDKERGRPNRQEVREYNIGSFIWPRFSEILINIVLTFWFTVDGFSSSLAARRTVRDYLLDSKGSRLAANAFLSKATVQFNADNTNVCQVLTFRGNLLSFKTLSLIVGGANLICFIGWAVLIAFEGGDSAPPLSIPRVAVMIAAIGIACFMDCLYMYSNQVFFHKITDYRVLSVIISEIVCIVAGSVVATTLGIKVFGKWVYSALQLLVWVKWIIGSYILDEYLRESPVSKQDDWKVLVFSSAFLLNAALAGVRSKWTPSWPWKDNYLFHRH